MPTEQTAASTDAGKSDAQTSQFTAPKIELPKGGGAIRGIGEKFEANAATGTGKLTIPLGLSAGRSGFTPALSLGYDSGSGNGPFGIGWSLSLPCISRKTDKGLPRYRHIEIAECDVFILSGSEDLVPALVEPEPDLWVDDEIEAEGHRIKRYRPRIEGLFARIERWTRLADGDEHWRSISKDNTLTVYGRDNNSRIFDPENPGHTFSWLISESYDDKGNAIAYEYVAEDDCGVDLTRANEARRVRTANRYLKRIKYGNRRPLLIDPDAPGSRCSHVEPIHLAHADWMFEAIFDYGDEPYSQSESEGRSWANYALGQRTENVWPVRVDPFSKYRSRFEVRTYRLCHRVLMLHHFPQELGSSGYLVRSTEFKYHQKTIGSFITSFTQSGYVLHSESRYLRKFMPPLEIEYTQSPLDDGRYLKYKVSQVDHSSLENLPAGIDLRNYRWIDLDGEGISGILTEQGSSWFYKHNQGNGHFGPTCAVAHKPSISELNRGGQQLLDVAGDGTMNLVQFDAAAPGFYTRANDGAWGAFRTFRQLPVMDWSDPNLRFVDVTGDGIADILITEDDAMLWHSSLLDDGFGPAIRVAVSSDERKGPHVIFSDGIQSIYLADMSGDGLSDLVRVRNGEVCYWPNQGYGAFGPKVVMDNAPWFADEDIFEQSRVHLTDTDGSGCTDIVYLGADAIRIYLNESGNSWSDPRTLKYFAPANSDTVVSVVDILGRGTACLLWSSSLPADYGKPLCYIDLMDGQKPHLLTRSRNNLGAETRIEYASSTEFYLADKAAGKPWVTRLPFPVHVVKRVETYDFISQNRFVTSYKYHHGFFDGYEREFRGFGMVEQLDTEEFATLSKGGEFPVGSNEDRASNVPPVLTKTWFHTGVFLGNRRVSRHLAHEYYREPVPHSPGGSEAIAAMCLDDTILPGHLTPEEAREACRALKGSTLRQEVYALDGKPESNRPYTVAESNSTITTLQPRLDNLHAIFFTHPREAVTYHYERKLYDIKGVQRADPRVAHSVTLDVDDYGNVLKAVSIGYGRRFPDGSALLIDADRAKQQKMLLTYTENRYTNAVQHVDSYRTPVVAESRTYELIHVQPSANHPGTTNLFRFDELAAKVGHASDGAHDLPYEDVDALGAVEAVPYRRLIEESRSYYRADRLDHILPFGIVEALALPGQSYKVAFTSGLLAEVYRRGEPPENLIPDVPHVLGHEGRYVDLTGDGRWWVPSGRVFYARHECDAHAELEHARRHFFLPRRFVDPFGNTTTVDYDPHDLSPVLVRDAVGNTISSEIDYRVLSPWRTTDANRNRAQVAFDALGMVVGTAVMGKPGQRAGDSLDGFEPDLDETIILEHLAHPLRHPHAILQQATTRLVYDLFAYDRTRGSARPQPAAVYTLVRETHAADLPPGEHTRFQHAFSYSDGFGREIQKKLQAEPGPIVEGGPKAEVRWIGSGWTIFNNKGKPVRQYEPFFSAEHRFEFANIVGVSSILFYDPVERVVATLHPNHTYEKVIFDPWRQESWDVNDTVLQANPAQDPDVGDFFANLPETDYLPTWHSQRNEGQLGKDEQQAALKTAVHANTPSIACADTLGRTFLSIAHNRFARAGLPVDEYFATRTELDIENNQLAVIDALGRAVMRYEYDMLSTRLRQISVDAGTRWMLNDAVGKPLLNWDSRMHRLRREYDALHRPTNLYVRIGSAPEFLAERIVYGEGQPNDQSHNLRGKPFQQFDAAGTVTSERYDFKGNLLKGTRQLLEDYKNNVDWSQSPELEGAIFTSAKTYDALNRPITITTPDASVARPRYNEANLLESLSVNLRGAQEPTPFVTYINYNAKGQREIIDYGNGANTRYAYDPLTFRMIHLRTTRKQDHARLQDLNYTFDPAGNITSIRDDAQETIYFKNHVVSASNDYIYDATYRLIWADGREHAGKPGEPQTTWNDAPRMHQPLPSDGHALHRYHEQYDYDAVGNILKLLHHAPDANWSRYYTYDEGHPYPRSNRLTSTQVGQVIEPYGYDTDGNMTHMPHMPSMGWDFKDQLHSTRRREANGGNGETTYYVYDASGQRVRKVTERGSGSRKNERTYLGGFELYREYDSVAMITLERDTLHVMNDKGRIALVDTETTTNLSSSVNAAVSQIRLQCDNHLGSAVLELDNRADVISYEEFYPYGSTSFEAPRGRAEVSAKRYRYVGKERDDESGLYYYGSRYYASWLGRWTSCDPLGIQDSSNEYQFVRGNPINSKDVGGFWTWKQVGIAAAVVTAAVVVTVATGGLGAAAAAAVIGGAELTGATAAAVTFGGVVAGGAGSGYLAGRAADATAQALTNEDHHVDMQQNKQAGTAGAAAGAVTSLIPGFAAARSAATAVESVAAAGNSARTAATAVRATTTAARVSRVAVSTARNTASGFAGGATYEATRQVVSGEASTKGFDKKAVLVAGVAGGITSAAVTPVAKAVAGKIRSLLQGAPSVYIPRDAEGNPIPLQRHAEGTKGVITDMPKPDPTAKGPHTTLGGKVGENGEVYRQSATFPGESWPKANGVDAPTHETDWTNHGRGDHPDPHVHGYSNDSFNKRWIRGPAQGGK